MAFEPALSPTSDSPTIQVGVRKTQECLSTLPKEVSHTRSRPVTSSLPQHMLAYTFHSSTQQAILPEL